MRSADALRVWDRIEAVCVLRATSPCRVESDVNDALHLLEQYADHPRYPVDAVVGVKRVTGMHPSRMKRIVTEFRGDLREGPINPPPDCGLLVDAYPEQFPETAVVPSQSLSAVVRNGAVYAVRADVLLGTAPWQLYALNAKDAYAKSVQLNAKGDRWVVQPGAEATAATAGSLWGHRAIPLVMPEERSVDINTMFDMRVAECVLHNGWHRNPPWKSS